MILPNRAYDYIVQALHDELQRRLSERDEGKRMDALRKVFYCSSMMQSIVNI